MDPLLRINWNEIGMEIWLLANAENDCLFQGGVTPNRIQSDKW